MTEAKGGILKEAYKKAKEKVRKMIGAKKPNADPMGLGNTRGGSSKSADEAIEALRQNEQN
jgi:hypothetical protein